ncbi:MAG: Negative regulator of beta-lactamase expression-like protein [Streptosporangiaceae bacterium]|nr:Negative regulator of beta-lactamase expression-like protein [Streptosporangiaceae bacterium]
MGRPVLRTAWAALMTPALLTPAVLSAMGGAAVAAPAPVPATRQQAFTAAAKAYGVPEQVVLGVAYLESRWDANAGRPSTSAGYGPMHLTDARSAPARPADHGGSAAGRGDEDPRGDDARPLTAREPAATNPTGAALGPAVQTLRKAARLTGLRPERLRDDPAANIRGGAALLASYQRDLGSDRSGDPADWYGAVARYSGATDSGSARFFADEVFATIRTGARRVTDDGQQVSLTAQPGLRPRTAALAKLGLRGTGTDAMDCPATLACEWIPAPYQQLSADPTDYGNHDLGDRPTSQKINYIVIHDTEISYDASMNGVRNPRGVSWQYTVRSADGHVAEHVRPNDVAWQAGNWYLNAKSIGIEHEGYLAQGGSWYTEVMYRSSARLVRYLAARFGVPLDREHVLGHDNIPGTTPGGVSGMHEDPGPYWDWAHYFRLLGRPLHATAGQRSGMVMILPDYETNVVAYTGCDAAHASDPCPAHGGGSIMLRTEPRADAPLVKDIGKHPPAGAATMSVYDHSARAATGQRYAVAGRQGEWTAIWYLGQKAWFHNPKDGPTAVGARGFLATPKPGVASVPVYGRAYPEAEAYPQGVPVQNLVPMQYTFAAGQSYPVGGAETGEYYYATTFDRSDHTVVRGKLRYYEIQFGHRVFYVKAGDVRLIPAF